MANTAVCALLEGNINRLLGGRCTNWRPVEALTTQHQNYGIQFGLAGDSTSGGDIVSGMIFENFDLISPFLFANSLAVEINALGYTENAGGATTFGGTYPAKSHIRYTQSGTVIDADIDGSPFTNPEALQLNRPTAQGAEVKIAPATGATYQVLVGTSVVNVAPAGTLAALTIDLSLLSGVRPGYVLHVAAEQTVTALTLSGGTVVGGPTTLTAATPFALRLKQDGSGAWQAFR